MLQIKPILAALKRHKAGTVLIAMQIALTLAIVCNAIFIIHQRLDRVQRPTGMVESDLMAIQTRFVGTEETKAGPLVKADLVALRQLPGVQDAVALNSYPLRGGGWSTGVRTDVDAKNSKAHTTQYFGDEHALPTMALKLIAGRNFRTDEIVEADPQAVPDPAVIIVSKALADKMYPEGSALGKAIYIGDSKSPSTIVGIVERLQVPWNGTWSDSFYENSLIQPVQLTSAFTNYLIRTKPGQLADVLKAAPAALVKANRMRVIPSERGVRSFAQVREYAYKGDRGMAILMGVVCLVLLGITAAGIVGLTSFWVGQRRKQIGVRRALGARKIDILHYFQIENLVIASVGAVIGLLLAIGLNLLLMHHFEMERLPVAYVLAGIVMVLALGQGAVFVPARRASNVPPVVATRAA